MSARKLMLVLFSFATLMLASPLARAVGLGQRCGGNVQNPPTCDTGLECIPAPADHGLPFGDVGGICAQVCGSNGTLPTCAAGTCVPDPFGAAHGVCAVPVPRAAIALLALLLGGVALRRITASTSA
jgi:hypothetical protein